MVMALRALTCSSCLLLSVVTTACGSNDQLATSSHGGTGAEEATTSNPIANANAGGRLPRSPGVGCNYTTAAAWDDNSFARLCQKSYQIWKSVPTGAGTAPSPSPSSTASSELYRDYEGFCSAVTNRTAGKDTSLTLHLKGLTAEDHLLVKSCPIQIVTLSQGVRKISDAPPGALNPQPATIERTAVTVR